MKKKKGIMVSMMMVVVLVLVVFYGSCSTVSTPIPITQNRSEEFVHENPLRTEVGIELTMSDIYEVTEIREDRFMFGLIAEAEAWGMNEFNTECTFSSTNAEIVKVECYYEYYGANSLIATIDCKEENSATVKGTYDGVVCNNVLLYITYNETLYTAWFCKVYG